MSREQIFIDLFSMLSDMTVLNGYSRDYTPVKSIDSDTNRIQNDAIINVSIGVEQSVQELQTTTTSYSMLPVTVKTRAHAPHTNKSDTEYAYTVERSQVLEDIKKRFRFAYREINPCVSIRPMGEDEIELDSNKNIFISAYNFELIYRETL